MDGNLSGGNIDGIGAKVQEVVDEKFKDLDNFLNKNMMKILQDLQEEMRLRMQEIDKSAQSRHENSKKDLLQKIN